MKKFACGITALVLMAGSLFAADSYYVFSGSNKVAWGAANYVYGYTYGTVAVGNPDNPDDPGKPNFFNDGVGKIVGASVTAGGGVFIGVNKSGGTTTTRAITDCTNGFSYWYNGGAHDINLEYGDANCTGTGEKWNNKWRATATAVTSWTKKTIALNGFTQVTGGACNVASVNLSLVDKIAWGTEAASTGYNLMIGNVACLADGTIADDVAPTATIAWAAGDEVCTGNFCKWGDDCGLIRTDKDNATNPITTCAEAIANCATHSHNPVYSNSTCTTPIATSSSSNTTTQSSSSATTTQSSSSATGTSSSSSGTDTSSSSDDEDTEPIISHNNAPVVGLNVVHFARSLQIASGKDATISLFDIRGKQVLSQRILSGTTTISLGKQKQGVYYVVAKSGSQKQIVKIILK